MPDADANRQLSLDESPSDIDSILHQFAAMCELLLTVLHILMIDVDPCNALEQPEVERLTAFHSLS